MKKAVIILALFIAALVFSLCGCTNGTEDVGCGQTKTTDKVTYIANTNSNKFHYPDCSSVERMNEENKWYFSGTRNELIDMGYEPCGRCNP